MLLFYGAAGEQTFTTTGEQNIIEAAVGVPGTVNFIGTTDGTTAVITAVSHTNELQIGMGVTGTGIPTNATIIAITATTITISANTTSANVGEALVASGGVEGGSYVNAIVMLYTNVVTLPARGATVASLGEATFTGYARSSAITWGASLVNVNGVPFVTGDKKQFICTGTAVSNDVNGAAILDATGTTVLQVCPFGSTVSFAVPGFGIDFVPVLSMTPQS